MFRPGYVAARGRPRMVVFRGEFLSDSWCRADVLCLDAVRGGPRRVGPFEAERWPGRTKWKNGVIGWLWPMVVSGSRKWAGKAAAPP